MTKPKQILPVNVSTSNKQSIAGYFYLPVHMLQRGMKFLTLHEDLCHSKKYFLLAIIHSAVQNRNKRDAIRKTWGKKISNQLVMDKYGRMKYLFILGKTNNSELQRTVEREDKEHGDIIQADFLDTYFNLTLKHLAVLKWTVDNCRNGATWILKGDDDVVVNTYKLLPYLASTPTKGSLLCYVIKNARVFRDGVWSISRKLYPSKTYPDYCSGPAYVMTVDVAEKLYNASHSLNPIFVDDVYVTGIVRMEAGVRLGRLPKQFQLSHYVLWDSNPIEVIQKLERKAVPIFGCFQGWNGTDKPQAMMDMWQTIVKKEEGISISQ